MRFLHRNPPFSMDYGKERLIHPTNVLQHWLEFSGLIVHKVGERL